MSKIIILLPVAFSKYTYNIKRCYIYYIIGELHF